MNNYLFRISTWAGKNPKKSITIVALLQFLLVTNAVFAGMLLKESEIEVPGFLLAGAAAISAIILFLYPKPNGIVNWRRRKKLEFTYSALAFFCYLLLSSNFNHASLNTLSGFVFQTETVYGSQSTQKTVLDFRRNDRSIHVADHLKEAKKCEAVSSTININPVNGIAGDNTEFQTNSATKKHNFFSKTGKQIKSIFGKNGEDPDSDDLPLKIFLFVMACVIAVILLVLIAVLTCVLACSNYIYLPFLVFIGGYSLVGFGIWALARGLFRKKPQPADS